MLKTQKAVKDNKVSEILGSKNPVKWNYQKNHFYGMFVDLGGNWWFSNHNEISYKGPVNPANYYSEGDEVSVVVLSYDKAKQHLIIINQSCIIKSLGRNQRWVRSWRYNYCYCLDFESYGAFVDLEMTSKVYYISEILGIKT